MLILGIETSCDETALALVECDGKLENPKFKVKSEALHSQIDLHKKFGGVFPMMAKREHANNLIPLFQDLLKKADFEEKNTEKDKYKITAEIEKMLEREPDLLEKFKKYVPSVEKPPIDAIAVTYGPGLEPALWVGINFAKALSLIWDIPLVPTNHMEGHIFSVLLNKDGEVKNIEFPVLALLVSGGHTELVLVKNWSEYKILGETRDDAVGEAYDKVARILGLPYPGGPEISKLAEEARSKNYPDFEELPRPMITKDNYDFSFSGLKTAVLYKVRDAGEISDQTKASIAREFENAVVDVLIHKTKRALLENEIKTFIIGGGVVANKHLRKSFNEMIKDFPSTKILLPDTKLSTDNAVMIAISGYLQIQKEGLKKGHDFSAKGSLRLS